MQQLITDPGVWQPGHSPPPRQALAFEFPVILPLGSWGTSCYPALTLGKHRGMWNSCKDTPYRRGQKDKHEHLKGIRFHLKDTFVVVFPSICQIVDTGSRIVIYQKWQKWQWSPEKNMPDDQLACRTNTITFTWFIFYLLWIFVCFIIHIKSMET